jgi:hypothetical protein
LARGESQPCAAGRLAACGLAHRTGPAVQPCGTPASAARGSRGRGLASSSSSSNGGAAAVRQLLTEKDDRVVGVGRPNMPVVARHGCCGTAQTRGRARRAAMRRRSGAVASPPAAADACCCRTHARVAVDGWANGFYGGGYTATSSTAREGVGDLQVRRARLDTKAWGRIREAPSCLRVGAATPLPRLRAPQVPVPLGGCTSRCRCFRLKCEVVPLWCGPLKCGVWGKKAHGALRWLSVACRELRCACVCTALRRERLRWHSGCALPLKRQCGVGARAYGQHVAPRARRVHVIGACAPKPAPRHA